MFFELAVVGPIATRGLGLGGQCLACRNGKSSGNVTPCTGFGAGCLVRRVPAAKHATGEKGANKAQT